MGICVTVIQMAWDLEAPEGNKTFSSDNKAAVVRSLSVFQHRLSQGLSHLHGAFYKHRMDGE